LDASTNFQANSTKSDFLPRAFLAPTMRSYRLTWKTKISACLKL